MTNVLQHAERACVDSKCCGCRPIIQINYVLGNIYYGIECACQRDDCVKARGRNLFKVVAEWNEKNA